MAILVDASTPARWTAVVDLTNGGTVTSAAFTAPANALLVLAVQYDTRDNWSSGTRTAQDSGGLTWTVQVERLGNETTAGGASGIWTARTTSSVSRTVSFVLGTASPSTGWGTGRVSAKLYVLTAVDVDGTPVDTVGAANENGSTTNNINTTSVTPGANGLLFCSDADWNALGAFEASSDLTQDTAHYAGELSVCSGYRTCTSGVGVTGNLNASGTSAAQHKWCQIVVREAGGGGETFNRRAPLLLTLGVGA